MGSQFSNFLASTPRDGLKEIFHSGESVISNHWSITALLAQRGLDCASLFAQPTLSKADSCIDWYTNLPGTGKPASALSEAERAQLMQACGAKVQAIHQLAAQLLVGSQADKKRGELLQDALRYPGEDCLYSVGGQPVLTCWGHTKKGQGPVDLIDTVKVIGAVPKDETKPPVIPVSPEPPVQPGNSGSKNPPDNPPTKKNKTWLLPLIVLGLLALGALLWWLLSSNGDESGKQAVQGTEASQALADKGTAADPSKPSALAEKKDGAADPNGKKDMESDGKDGQAGSLAQSGEQAASSRETASSSAALGDSVSGSSASSSSFRSDSSSSSKDYAGGAAGENGVIRSASSSSQESSFSRESSSSGPAWGGASSGSSSSSSSFRSDSLETSKLPPVMVPNSIPETAVPFAMPQKAGDLSFLKGELRADRALANDKGVPLNFSMSFPGENGEGTASISDGSQVCQGQIKAVLEHAGTMVLSSDGLTCPSGNDFAPFTMMCSGKGNGKCVGMNKSGETWELPLYFVQSFAKEAARQLSIPENAKELSFLQGKWKCDTGLMSSYDHNPIVFLFAFGKDGDGTCSCTEKDGTEFSGPAKAKLENGQLEIRVERQTSPSMKRSYSPEEISCRQEGGYALCNGVEADGTRWNNVRFERVE